MPVSDPEIDALLRFSRHGQRLIAADPALRSELAENLDTPWSREAMLALLASYPISDEASLKVALRGVKKRVALRIMARDLSGRADLTEVMLSITTLAEVAVQEALRHLSNWQQAAYGPPIGAESGTVQELIVVGMGKLGGNELNVSSDIDLIYIYPEEGQAGRLSNHEYFTKLAQKLTQAISEHTENGYVFRVDLRLRPYGDSGPVVSSFAMLEEYLITQGREWERYAWIKGRALSGDATGLDQLVRPFVYRKYLDYGAIASMRDLHAQIRREVARRELADNIKLGPGGIREIEFTAQVFQLIRGGKENALQLRPTRATLDLLAARGLLPAATVTELQAAYEFLRKLEHRLQYLEDAQTQNLPENEADRSLIAEAMGHADWAAFRAALDIHRAAADRAFSDVFADEARPSDGSPWQTEDGTEKLAELGYPDPARAVEQLTALKQGQRYANLPEKSKIRFNQLMPRIIETAAQHGNPNDTLARMIALMETVARRESYLALLAEYPDTLTHVAKLCAASPWAAGYLTQFPLLLDELLDPRALLEKRDWATLRKKLREELGDYAGTERQMDTLRHFKHAQTFHLLAQDLEGLLTVEQLSDELTALAECLLDEVLRISWASITKKHCDTPRFAIIGYGKLGGKEMGYASDLDIVFLHDDPHEDAPATYARLVQRMNSWLTTHTAAGILYETDSRLRPDGASGLMVSSVAAFDDYQKHHAWVWEHQALTRARFVAGNAEIGAAFEHIRREVICQPRDAAKLREEVIAMRQKMRDVHHGTPEQFDIKHDPGGLVDVEFMVQYLILAHAHQHPQLADNVGNIALLKRAAELGLIASDAAQQVGDAYRELRRQQHRIRMQGLDKARIAPETLREQAEAVKALWQSLLA